MCVAAARTIEAGKAVSTPPSPDNLSLDVGTISISGQMCKSLRDLLTLWILLSQNKETAKNLEDPKGFTVDALLSTMDPEMQDVGRLLQELELGGASLVSINGKPCRGALSVDKVLDLLISKEGSFTMVFTKADGDEWTKRIVILKPILQQNRPADSEEEGGSFWADVSCTFEPVEAEPSSDSNEPTARQASKSNKRSSHRHDNPKDKVQKELCVGPIKQSHPQWMKLAPLDEGDRILGINEGTTLPELDPDDANSIISKHFDCAPVYLSLLVRTPPSKRGPKGASWRRHLRRGGVAFSGSTMVGAGAVLMVTPLHPLGHAMAIGGVAILGTEFKGPRQAAKRASSGFANFAGNMRQSWHNRRERRAAARANKSRSSTPASTSSSGSDSTSSISSVSVMGKQEDDNVSTK